MGAVIFTRYAVSKSLFTASNLAEVEAGLCEVVDGFVDGLVTSILVEPLPSDIWVRTVSCEAPLPLPRGRPRPFPLSDVLKLGIAGDDVVTLALVGVLEVCVTADEGAVVADDFANLRDSSALAFSRARLTASDVSYLVRADRKDCWIIDISSRRAAVED